MTVVKLSCCAGMKTNGRTTFFFSDQTCREESQKVLVDSDSELDRNRNTFSVSDRRTNNAAQQIRFYRNSRATTFSRYLWNGTTKIHIEMIDPSFVHEELHSLCNIMRIRTI